MRTLLPFGVAVALLARQGFDFRLQFSAQLVQIQLAQHRLHGFGAHHRLEAAAVGLLHDGAVLVVVNQVMQGDVGHGGVAGIKDDKIREIQHLIQHTGGQLQQHTHAAGDSLVVPDMAHGRSKFDMTHALAANLGARDGHAALVAHEVLVLRTDALVLAAGALPVLRRAEDALAVQAVFFGLQGTIVDGFGLGDFTMRPLPNLLRRGHADLDGVKIGQLKQKGSHSLHCNTGVCPVRESHQPEGDSCPADRLMCQLLIVVIQIHVVKAQIVQTHGVQIVVFLVVIEEVDENEYFHDRRLMVSIFMSIVNVHANWYPVDGTIKKVAHHNGNFMKAWLPKASTENERSTVVIETPEGVEILTRQIAGAVARRIVTYAEVGEECYIDEHMGFIKFGSRVDVYLPIGTEICVKMGQLTTGNQTVIAKLK